MYSVHTEPEECVGQLWRWAVDCPANQKLEMVPVYNYILFFKLVEQKMTKSSSLFWGGQDAFLVGLSPPLPIATTGLSGLMF